MLVLTLYRRRGPLLKNLLWPKKFKNSASSTLSPSGYVSGIPTTGSSGAIMAESEQDYYYGGGGSSYYYQTFYDEDHTQVRIGPFHNSVTPFSMLRAHSPLGSPSSSRVKPA